MRAACIGGGPAGLYFAISMKLRDPAHEVTVFERNRPDDTFGWGVVLSDEALGNLAVGPTAVISHPHRFTLGIGQRIEARDHSIGFEPLRDSLEHLVVLG